MEGSGAHRRARRVSARPKPARATAPLAGFCAFLRERHCHAGPLQLGRELGPQRFQLAPARLQFRPPRFEPGLRGGVRLPRLPPPAGPRSPRHSRARWPSPRAPHPAPPLLRSRRGAPRRAA